MMSIEVSITRPNSCRACRRASDEALRAGFAYGKLLGAKLRGAKRLGELRVRHPLPRANDRKGQARQDRDNKEEFQVAAPERERS